MPNADITPPPPLARCILRYRQEFDVWLRGQGSKAKWMLGALPGIKLMNLTAASGHHDTNTAWVVTHAQRGVFGSGRGEKTETINACRLSFHLHIAHFMCATFLLDLTCVLCLTSRSFEDTNDV